MREIKIPKIYVEEIIGVIFNGEGDVHVKYKYGEKTIDLLFHSVYYFDYCEWDYINEIDWEFGLMEYEKSKLIDEIFSRVNFTSLENSFGDEPDKIKHYKLSIDDWGIYNILCKDCSF